VNLSPQLVQKDKLIRWITHAPDLEIRSTLPITRRMVPRKTRSITTGVTTMIRN
jgi:hypothetical protein